MAPPLAKAELIGTLLETICYGMYLAISLKLFRLLYARLQAGRQTRYLFATAVLIFFLVTVYLVLQVNVIVEGFTGHMDVANAPVTYFSTVSIRVRTAEASVYSALILICDALLVYRVFVMYERKYVWIIIPSMLYLADVALSILSVLDVAHIQSKVMTVKGAHARLNHFYAATLAINFMCTVMISWKIWAIHRSMPRPAIAGVRFMGVMAVIVESAVIYSCVLIAVMVENAIGTTVLWIIFNSVCPIVGMIFSAVMVRASREYHSDTFMSANLSLPMHYSTGHTTYSDNQETVSNVGDAGIGQTVQVPSAARKRDSLAFHVSTSPDQASRPDAIEKGHQKSGAEI